MPTTPSEVMAAARPVRGMVAFFALLGQQARGPEARRALDVLVSLRPDDPDWRARAWFLVDGWQGAVARERKTGWSAETVAMGTTMDGVPGWDSVDWIELARCLAQKPTPAP